MDKIVALIRENTLFFFLAALTLGLAPFSPEPHIVGKIRWVAGGAVGMKGKDWFDLFLHGIPFVLLVLSLILRMVKQTKTPKKS